MVQKADLQPAMDGGCLESNARATAAQQTSAVAYRMNTLFGGCAKSCYDLIVVMPHRLVMRAVLELRQELSKDSFMPGDSDEGTPSWMHDNRGKGERRQQML